MKRIVLIILAAVVVFALVGEGVYGQLSAPVKRPNILMICLLYTSDAADE